MLVHNFLENSAQKFPDKKAVWYKNEWMTYEEIESSSNKVANYLIESGIKKGDRVAILLENSFEYVIAYYAILKTGATTVALNTETTTDSLIYLFNDCGAAVLITQQKFSRTVGPAISKSHYLKHIIADQDDLAIYQEIGHCDQIKLKDIYKNYKNNSPQVKVIDADLASIVYTSGSTGKPKGVCLTHLNIVTNTRSIVDYLEVTDSDRIMVVLPFYYIYGKSLLNTHFYSGGSVVIDNRFAFANVILETMENTKVTGFSGVPSTFMILLNKSSAKSKNFDYLRYVTQAGGAMAPVVQEEVMKVFSPAKLFIMYGATEASARLTYLHPEMVEKKLGSIGKGIPNVEVFIADQNGNPMPNGDVGEIVARGSNIMQRYWNDSDETEKVLRNGLYYTGDLGKMDSDGYLFVVGRTKQMIKVGGERISPKEIEEAILEINEVHEVAVIGVDDDILGEAIKAVIVANKSETDEEMIRKFLKKRLPVIKQPKYIEFVGQLPKNASGKIIKSELK